MNLADAYDEDLGERALYLDAAIIDHNAYCCCDGEECPTGPLAEALREITAECDRRVAAGIYLADPDRLTFEERYAPYGPAWAQEQAEREGFA